MMQFWMSDYMVKSRSIIHRVAIWATNGSHAHYHNDYYCHQHTQYLVDGYNLIVENHTSRTLDDTPQYHEEYDIVEVHSKRRGIEKISHNYFGFRPFEN
jgi:hypothetical protein